MPRLTNTAPNRLLDVDEMYLLPTGDIGILNIESDDGTIELALTTGGAVVLMDRLVKFVRQCPPERVAEEFGRPDPFPGDDWPWR